MGSVILSDKARTQKNRTGERDIREATEFVVTVARLDPANNSDGAE